MGLVGLTPGALPAPAILASLRSQAPRPCLSHSGPSLSVTQEPIQRGILRRPQTPIIEVPICLYFHMVLEISALSMNDAWIQFCYQRYKL